MGCERAERFRNKCEELLFPGRRGSFVMVGGWGGVRKVREKETSEFVILAKGCRLRFRHEGDSRGRVIEMKRWDGAKNCALCDG
jgi:hypothetical protein